MMNSSLIAIGIALLTGALIAVQSNWSGLAGKQLGAFTATLFGLTAGGTVAVLLLALRPALRAEHSLAALGYAVAAGLMGILIGTSISWVVQRLGVTAGLASITLGQFLVSFLMDALGLGTIAVPLEARRVVGLGLMLLAVYLLTPRS